MPPGGVSSDALRQMELTELRIMARAVGLSLVGSETRDELAQKYSEFMHARAAKTSTNASSSSSRINLQDVSVTNNTCDGGIEIDPSPASQGEDSRPGSSGSSPDLHQLQVPGGGGMRWGARATAAAVSSGGVNKSLLQSKAANILSGGGAGAGAPKSSTTSAASASAGGVVNMPTRSRTPKRSFAPPPHWGGGGQGGGAGPHAGSARHQEGGSSSSTAPTGAQQQQPTAATLSRRFSHANKHSAFSSSSSSPSYDENNGNTNVAPPRRGAVGGLGGASFGSMSARGAAPAGAPDAATTFAGISENPHWKRPSRPSSARGAGGGFGGSSSGSNINSANAMNLQSNRSSITQQTRRPADPPDSSLRMGNAVGGGGQHGRRVSVAGRRRESSAGGRRASVGTGLGVQYNNASSTSQQASMHSIHSNTRAGPPGGQTQMSRGVPNINSGLSKSNANNSGLNNSSFHSTVSNESSFLNRSSANVVASAGAAPRGILKATASNSLPMNNQQQEVHPPGPTSAGNQFPFINFNTNPSGHDDAANAMVDSTNTTINTSTGMNAGAAPLQPPGAGSSFYQQQRAASRIPAPRRSLAASSSGAMHRSASAPDVGGFLHAGAEGDIDMLDPGLLGNNPPMQLQDGQRGGIARAAAPGTASGGVLPTMSASGGETIDRPAAAPSNPTPAPALAELEASKSEVAVLRAQLATLQNEMAATLQQEKEVLTANLKQTYRQEAEREIARQVAQQLDVERANLKSQYNTAVEAEKQNLRSGFEKQYVDAENAMRENLKNEMKQKFDEAVNFRVQKAAEEYETKIQAMEQDSRLVKAELEKVVEEKKALQVQSQSKQAMDVDSTPVNNNSSSTPVNNNGTSGAGGMHNANAMRKSVSFKDPPVDCDSQPSSGAAAAADSQDANSGTPMSTSSASKKRTGSGNMDDEDEENRLTKRTTSAKKNLMRAGAGGFDATSGGTNVAGNSEDNKTRSVRELTEALRNSAASHNPAQAARQSMARVLAGKGNQVDMTAVLAGGSSTSKNTGKLNQTNESVGDKKDEDISMNLDDDDVAADQCQCASPDLEPEFVDGMGLDDEVVGTIITTTSSSSTKDGMAPTPATSGHAKGASKAPGAAGKASKGPPAKGPSVKGGKKGIPPAPPGTGTGNGKGAPVPGKGGKKAGGKGGKPVIPLFTGVKLRPVFWSEIKDVDPASFWVASNSRVSDDAIKIDEKCLEAQFPAVAAKVQIGGLGASSSQNGGAPNAQQPGDPSNPNSPRDKLLTILDSKRQQHLNIVFKQLPSPNWVVDSLNGYNPPLKLEQATLLYKEGFITEQERSKMQQLHSGKQPHQRWGLPEQYFIAVTKARKSFETLRAWSFIGTFGPQAAECREQIAEFKAAISVLTENAVLERILKMMLKVGNRMNAGTIRGNIKAFTLESLPKFGELKNIENNRTLLSFVLLFLKTDCDSMVVDDSSSVANSANNTNSSGSVPTLQQIREWKLKITRAKRVSLDELDSRVSELAKEASCCSQDCYTEAARLGDSTEMDNTSSVAMTSHPMLRYSGDIMRFAAESGKLKEEISGLRGMYFRALQYYSMHRTGAGKLGGNGSSQTSGSFGAAGANKGSSAAADGGKKKELSEEEFLAPFEELFSQMLVIQQKGY